MITLSETEATGGSPFSDRADVASVGQCAVSPRAREKGISAPGLDTSEHAAGLISLYEAKGHRFIEYVQWRRTNYRSVILGKSIE